ncbi:MAG: hypothetical protein ACO1QB_18840 [Verrucomicrobiales bacterium]
MAKPGNQARATPGPLGVLDQLSPDRQDELFDLLSSFPTRVVQARISGPPPDGWGIHTHITSLRRFYRRREAQLLQEEFQAQESASPDLAATTPPAEVALGNLLQKVLYQSLAPEGEAKNLQHAFKCLTAINTLNHQRERMKLNQKKLDLEKVRQLTRAISTSLKLSSDMDSTQFSNLLKKVNTMLDASAISPA